MVTSYAEAVPSFGDLQVKQDTGWWSHREHLCLKGLSQDRAYGKEQNPLTLLPMKEAAPQN